MFDANATYSVWLLPMQQLKQYPDLPKLDDHTLLAEYFVEKSEESFEASLTPFSLSFGFLVLFLTMTHLQQQRWGYAQVSLVLWTLHFIPFLLMNQNAINVWNQVLKLLPLPM